jgi:hypothetical protein
MTGRHSAFFCILLGRGHRLFGWSLVVAAEEQKPGRHRGDRREQAGAEENVRRFEAERQQHYL